MASTIFQTIQDSALSRSIGQLDAAYGIVAQLLHISGLLLLLTPLLLINLRLLDRGLTGAPLSVLVQKLTPWQWLGLALLTLSGLFMWAPGAALYQPNPAFTLKFVLLGLALLLQLTLYRWVLRHAHVAFALRLLLVTLSFLLWFGVGLAGRAVGFVAA